MDVLFCFVFQSSSFSQPASIASCVQKLKRERAHARSKAREGRGKLTSTHTHTSKQSRRTTEQSKHTHKQIHTNTPVKSDNVEREKRVEAFASNKKKCVFISESQKSRKKVKAFFVR